MRLGVVGSREWVDLDAVRLYLQKLHRAGDLDSVVSGNAPGVDRTAEQWALRHGLPVLSYRPRNLGNDYGIDRVIIEADGTRHTVLLPERFRGFAPAAFVRNGYIVEAADAVVAFHHRNSRGTADSIAKAREAGNLREVLHG